MSREAPKPLQEQVQNFLNTKGLAIDTNPILEALKDERVTEALNKPNPSFQVQHIRYLSDIVNQKPGLITDCLVAMLTSPNSDATGQLLHHSCIETGLDKNRIQEIATLNEAELKRAAKNIQEETPEPGTEKPTQGESSDYSSADELLSSDSEEDSESDGSSPTPGAR